MIILFYLVALFIGHVWVGGGGGGEGWGYGRDVHRVLTAGVGMEDRGGRDSIVSGGGGRGSFHYASFSFDWPLLLCI